MWRDLLDNLRQGVTSLSIIKNSFLICYYKTMADVNINGLNS